MVDMLGIDLAEANRTVVPGLYSRITEAVNSCGDVVLYNWKFAGIDIAPQHTHILLGNPITINGSVQVTDMDEVTVIGLPPPIVPVSPLEVVENGFYEAAPPASGFNPVRVTVPPPRLISLTAEENGTYDPSDYNADGFNEVIVDVPETQRSYQGTHVWTTSTGAYDAAVSVQEGIYSGFNFVPTSEVVNVSYASATTERLFSQLGLQYVSPYWIVRALIDLKYFGGGSLPQGQTVRWLYSVTAIHYFYKEE